MSRRGAVPESVALSVMLGALLACLTVYTSILSYGLREYSRSRLSQCLGEARQGRWLEFLDRYESELAVISSFTRLLVILATMTWGYALFLADEQPPFARLPFLQATILNLALLVVCGIGIPHAIAVYAGEAVLARSMGVLYVMRVAFYPVGRLLLFIDFIVRRLLGRPESSVEEETERLEREILDAVSDGELHGAVDEAQKEIIKGVFELHETTVSEVMTPRTDIAAIGVDASYEDVRKTLLEEGHSRVPVYENSLDHIVGVLYAKDMLRLHGPEGFNIRELMRAVPFVPESKTCDELLREFRQQRVHIAIVLDEYGGTAGLVTIEDILEELVGEIDDEYDESAPPAIMRIDDDTLEVDGRVHIHEVNEELDLGLPEDADYETIAGFVFTTLGRIPTTGEQFTHESLQVTVTAAEPRKISRVRLHVLRPVQSE